MTDPVCKVTVRESGAVVLQYAGQQYESRLNKDRWLEGIVQRLDRLAKEHPTICEPEDLHLLGEALFLKLFGQRAKQIFETAENQRTDAQLQTMTLGDVFLGIVDAHKASRSDTRLRVSLVFENGTDSHANLPWEFLYVYRSDKIPFFVASEGTKLSLTRIVEPPLTGRQPSNPLRMLVVLSQPRELDYRQEKDEFDKLLDNLQTQLGLPSKPAGLFQPTWKALTERLAEPPGYDIIHFVGHGQFLNGKSKIAVHLSEEARKLAQKGDPQSNPPEADWRNVEELKAHLGTPPWLFFLQTCNSGRADGQFGAFRSAAQQIAQADVPFVVAMQYAIAADDARSFADKFYEELGRGSSVDDAVMRGRELLGKRSPSYGHPRFATPVVYLRSEVLPAARGAAEAQPQWCPHCGDKKVPPGFNRCTCPKRLGIVYCKREHANVPGETECVQSGCNAPLMGRPSTTSAPTRPSPAEPSVA